MGAFSSLITSLALGHFVMPALEPNAVIFGDILGALFLGLLVGYERSYRGRAAGMRTYGFVCMASCALTAMLGYQKYWFGGQEVFPDMDPTRVMQGITTGIGFLGAGVIMRDGLNISGLTTAASIWAVSTVGILMGVGFYEPAIFLTALLVAFMMWGSKIEFLFPSRHAVAVTMHFNHDITPSEADIRKLFLEHGYEIAKGSFAINARKEKHEWRFVVVSINQKRGSSLIKLSHALAHAEGVESCYLSHSRN